MKSNFTVPFSKIIKEFSLETVYAPNGLDEFTVSSTEINRPGLQMAGYFKYFDSQRIQVIGKAEESYLENLGEAEANERIKDLLTRLRVLLQEA